MIISIQSALVIKQSLMQGVRVCVGMHAFVCGVYKCVVCFMCSVCLACVRVCMFVCKGMCECVYADDYTGIIPYLFLVTVLWIYGYIANHESRACLTARLGYIITYRWLSAGFYTCTTILLKPSSDGTST